MLTHLAGAQSLGPAPFSKAVQAVWRWLLGIQASKDPVQPKDMCGLLQGTFGYVSCQQLGVDFLNGK